MLPLISCVMPTSGRPEFARAAVAGYLAQTYPNLELVIADDAARPSFDGPPGAASVRYYVCTDGVGVGAKRNWVNALARGEIIAHWDDDDWYAAHRIAEQYAFLLHSGADVVGYRNTLFAAESGRVWRYVGRPDYLIGSSMMYWRSAWERSPFPANVPIGSDTHWQRDGGFRVATIPAESMMARNHGGNLNKRDDAELAKHDCWEEA